MKDGDRILAALDGLASVAVARIAPDGVLASANAGFLRLLPGRAIGDNARMSFVSPTLARLSAPAPSPGEPSYRGLMTIGEREGKTWTLRGSAFAGPEGVLVVAEHDIEELERLGEAVLALNQELAKASRELQAANRRLVHSEAQVRELSLRDPLTGLANRRRLEESSMQELARAERLGTGLAVLMGDLDHFKQVNDRFGHDAGDAVLRAFGAILASQVRRTDIAARYGGEEFVVLLVGAGEAAALALAARIREKLRQAEVPPLDRAPTASFGAAALRPGESWESLLKRADEALYEAKRAGRDRACASDTGRTGQAAPLGPPTQGGRL